MVERKNDTQHTHRRIVATTATFGKGWRRTRQKGCGSRSVVTSTMACRENVMRDPLNVSRPRVSSEDPQARVSRLCWLQRRGSGRLTPATHRSQKR